MSTRALSLTALSLALIWVACVDETSSSSSSSSAATGGNAQTGGGSVGGDAMGNGGSVGGNAAGGNASGGHASGGMASGGHASGGMAPGGMGGDPSGGSGPGGSGGASDSPCDGNPCDDGGDTSAVCTESGGGYTCDCGSGFLSNGTTCNGSPTAMSFFISSTSPSANEDGNLGGLAGADAHCKALAAAVDSTRTEWVAYLSVEGDPNSAADDINAGERIGTGPWYNADEVMFAPDLASLHAIEPAIIACNPGPATCLADRAAYILAKPDDALFLFENGVQVTDPLQGGGRGHDIFTGSLPDGTVDPSGTCDDWTSNANNRLARVGHTDAPTNTQFSPSWNSAHDTVSCTQSGVASRGGAGFIYCFARD